MKHDKPSSCPVNYRTVGIGGSGMVCIALGIAFIFAVAFKEAHSDTPPRHEAQYVTAWCNAAGGETEHRLPDRTRVDCLLDEYAVEFDWSFKWAECIGQAAFYAEMSSRKAACVLIQHRKDRLRSFYRFANRARIAAKRANVIVVCLDTSGASVGCSRNRASQPLQ